MIALGLMAFIVLLVLSLVTMVKVETATATISKAEEQAKMNARMGAMTALAQLQELAGPDQRVTARADVIFDPGGPTVNITQGQAHWTGVWSSKLDQSGNPLNDATDVLVGLDNNNVQWLVSGENPDVNNVAADRVALATEDVSVNRPEETVQAPRVEIRDAENFLSGYYAYWVSDDGVKARVNMDSPYQGASADNLRYYDASIAQFADPSVTVDEDGNRRFSPGNSAAVSLWRNESTPVVSVADNESISLLTEDNDKADLQREFFHEFTVDSKSVLTNVKDGGIKRDLSTALEVLPNDLTGPIFPAITGGGVQDGDPGGPTWEQLADFYQESVAGNPGTGINFELQDNDTNAIAPIMTRFHFIVQVFADRKSVVSSQTEDLAIDYQYSVGIFPLITLWNPYDEDMTIPDLGLETDMRGVFLVDHRGLNGQAPNINNPGDDNLADLINKWGSHFTHPQDQNRNMIGFRIQGGVIPAGEARTYTPSVNSFMDFGDYTNNVLSEGAGGSLVTGFFSQPRNIPPKTPAAGSAGVDTTTIPFKFNEADPNSKSRIAFAPHANVDLQVTNLYSAPFEDDANPDLRFLAVIGAGPGVYYRTSKAPRVVDIRELDSGFTSFNDFVFPAGSSATEGNTGISDVDLNIVESWATTLIGTGLRMKFANTEGPEYDYWNEQTVHLLSQMNPRAPYVTDQAHVRSMRGLPNSGRTFIYRLYGTNPTAWWDSSNTQTSNYLGGVDSGVAYVGLGHDDGAEQGSDQMILFQAPTRPPVGIGQFMHANLMNVDRVGHSLDGNSWYSNMQQPFTMPTYAIGNSIANIHLPLTETSLAINDTSGFFNGGPRGMPNNYNGAHYDYSYLLNEALWDEFFMSSIIPSLNPGVSFPLPNGRMIKKNNSVTTGDLLDNTRAAANLYLEGGFNVNSTSVAAWESILGALRDVQTLGQASVSQDLRHNFARFAAPKLSSTGEKPDYNDAGIDSLVAGYRNLSDNQITALANSIVDEIKTRSAARGYPFLSLGAFVNRSIDASDVSQSDRRRFAYTGPLQFAIEQSEINGRPALNETWGTQLGDGLWNIDYITAPLPTETAPYYGESLEVVRNRPFIDGAPGSLTQADVLAKIGPALTARSDTFTIRSFGSAVDPLTGQETAKAYCEMVVQRSPDFVDPSNRSFDDPANFSAVNEQFGRKFEVVSFRWLSENEI